MDWEKDVAAKAQGEPKSGSLHITSFSIVPGHIIDNCNADCIFLIKLYQLATKYDVPGLRTSVITKFEKSFGKCPKEHTIAVVKAML